MKPFGRRFIIALLIASSCTATVLRAQPVISLSVDLRDAPRKMLHSTEIIAVQPGAMTLAYPKWIRNEHVPAPIAQQAGLVIAASAGGAAPGEPIAWKRDPLDPYLYRIIIPEGVHSVEVKADFITTNVDGSLSATSDAKLAVLDWNTVVLYPYLGPGTRVADLTVAPQVTLPQGWRFASSLHPFKAASPSAAVNVATFQPVSLEALVDSPLIAGMNFREIALAPEVSPKHYLDIVAERPEDLDVPQARVDELSVAIRQAGYLFRSHHYDAYHFLITLSNNITVAEVDHHQSLDNRRPEGFFHDEKRRKLSAKYTIHDFIHSWSGKYRRPEGLATPNFQVPVDATGMWMYEGLTNYLADVLTTRSGISTPQDVLDSLAARAAYFEDRPGRRWRNLEDTAAMSYPLWAVGDSSYDNWRRNGFDTYGEGSLIWLEIDTIIRNKTSGKKSLDDFLALFHGLGGDTHARVAPYSFDDIVSGLNQVVQNDWAGLLNERLHSLAPVAPLGGLTGGGYRLVYRESPDKNFDHSLAMNIGQDGVIADVIVGGIADTAGFGPGMKILSVNGQTFATVTLQHAIDAAKDGGPAIDFDVDNTGVRSTLSLAYHGGQRHPVLERIPGTPDRISEILRPLTR